MVQCCVQVTLNAMKEQIAPPHFHKVLYFLSIRPSVVMQVFTGDAWNYAV